MNIKTLSASLFIFVVSVITLIDASPVFANAFPDVTFSSDPFDYLFIVGLIALPVWIFNAFFESILFGLFFHKIANNLGKIILKVWLANLITVLPMLYLGYAVESLTRNRCLPLLNMESCIFISKTTAELIPFFGEFCLYLWLLKNETKIVLSRKYLFFVTFLANALTFSIGLFLLR
jgi:hypothetical protein